MWQQPNLSCYELKVIFNLKLWESETPNELSISRNLFCAHLGRNETWCDHGNAPSSSLFCGGCGPASTDLIYSCLSLLTVCQNKSCKRRSLSSYWHMLLPFDHNRSTDDSHQKPQLPVGSSAFCCRCYLPLASSFSLSTSELLFTRESPKGNMKLEQTNLSLWAFQLLLFDGWWRHTVFNFQNFDFSITAHLNWLFFKGIRYFS